MRWRKRRRTWRTPGEWIAGHWPDWWFAWYPVQLATGEMVWLERVRKVKETKSYSYTSMCGGKIWRFYTVTTYHFLD